MISTPWPDAPASGPAFAARKNPLKPPGPAAITRALPGRVRFPPPRAFQEHFMAAKSDYRVADIKLADWGRREIKIAEIEMPGLMATRAEFGKQQPLKGARIAGSLHMTIQ